MVSCTTTSCINFGRNICLLVCFFLFILVVRACPNGCSSRGVCIDGVCACAEGLTGADCSRTAPLIPSPYACPECYTLTVGPAMYYYGPSWRLPDGPIVALNNMGNISVFQGNGNAELLAQGYDIEDWEITPQVSLVAGGDFDVCGAWLMRAFSDGNKVRGFYHAERACDYNNNGQTRKSAGYAESMDGGLTFTKIGYPANKIVDTNSSETIGLPSGEGDYGVVIKDNYYYMFFSNVEDNTFGVARATVSSGGTPGSWFKYYNGGWTEPGLGGKSTPMSELTGTQAYLHTPSDSFISVGNRDAYFQSGTALSTSNDGVDWSFLGDPLIGGDFATNRDTVLYQSFIGKTGGFDVGSEFDLFYMWLPPGDTWTTRYQVRRSVSLTYAGNANSNSAPSTRLALTSYAHRETGERYESIELAIYPYMPIKIAGYIMTRPYPNTFPIYECYSYSTLDHFIGTADECFDTNVEAYRVAGHIWAKRVARSVAIYRCLSSNDTFITTDADCEGLDEEQTKPFGYVMQGPDISPAVMANDILIGQGSTWSYAFGSTPSSQSGVAWTALAYDATRWVVGSAPFGTGYSSDIVNTPFGKYNYYFRKTFTVAPGRTLERLVASVASDDFSYVYVNGVLVDSDATTHHEAAYWNRQVSVPLSLISLTGPNIVAVQTKNYDQWAFFDMQLSARYTEEPAETTLVSLACDVDCGVKGQCIKGECVCESGWTGLACVIPLCQFTEFFNDTIIAKGSSWRHTQWSYVATTPGNWFVPSYSDAWWHLDSSPFGSSSYTYDTYIPTYRHLFRKTFLIDVPYDQIIFEGRIYIASAANHRVWLNGVFLGAPIYPMEWHTAKRWNQVITVHGSLFTDSANTLAVEINPNDGTYFDMQLTLTFATKSCVIDTTTSAAAASTTTAAAAVSTAAATSAAATSAAATSAVATSAAATSAAATSASATSAAAAYAAATSAAATSAAATSAAATSAAATSAAATSAAATSAAATSAAATSAAATSAAATSAAATSAAATSAAATSAAATSAAATSAAATSAAATSAAATSAAATSAAATSAGATSAAATSASATSAAATSAAATSAAATSAAATSAAVTSAAVTSAAATSAAATSAAATSAAATSAAATSAAATSAAATSAAATSASATSASATSASATSAAATSASATSAAAASAAATSAAATSAVSASASASAAAASSATSSAAATSAAATSASATSATTAATSSTPTPLPSTPKPTSSSTPTSASTPTPAASSTTKSATTGTQAGVTPTPTPGAGTTSKSSTTANPAGTTTTTSQPASTTAQPTGTTGTKPTNATSTGNPFNGTAPTGNATTALTTANTTSTTDTHPSTTTPLSATSLSASSVGDGVSNVHIDSGASERRSTCALAIIACALFALLS